MNNVLIKLVKRLDDIQRETFKQRVMERFDIVEGQTKDKPWLLGSDTFRIKDNNGEQQMHTMNELVKGMSHTILMSEDKVTRQTEESSPHSWTMRWEEQKKAAKKQKLSEQPALKQELQKTAESGESSFEWLQDTMSKARRDLSSRLREVQHSVSKTSNKLYNAQEVGKLYRAVRSMSEWHVYGNNTCVLIVAAMEKDEFICNTNKWAVIRYHIREWYRDTTLIGDKLKFAVNLRSAKESNKVTVSNEAKSEIKTRF
jgi:hypothetical protein